LRVIFRVLNDIIAFRYEWPEQAALKDFNIMDELAEFVFPADHMALWQPV
jgi:alpha-glucosidase